MRLKYRTNLLSISTIMITLGALLLPLAAAVGVRAAGPQQIPILTDHDMFGYTWNESEPLAWIDATKGTDTGMHGDSDTQHTGPIQLPFRFPFYGDRYAALYISGSGYVTFQETTNWPAPKTYPNAAEPNGLIAAYGRTFALGNSGPAGRVFYRSGGTPPNRYFAVAWNQVPMLVEQRAVGSDTFELVLYENGDTVVQFATMEYNNDPYGNGPCGTTGIENADGSDGLWYTPYVCFQPNHQAVRFVRPPAADRVEVTPHGEAAFVQAGDNHMFRMRVKNSGDIGTDTYKAMVDSPWPAQILDADGLALSDSDGDQVPDTGPLPVGSSTELLVVVQPPSFAPLAADNHTLLTLQSTHTPEARAIADLYSLIPAPFALAYYDSRLPGVSVKEYGPMGERTWRLSYTASVGEMAIEATPSGYLVAWEERPSQEATATSKLRYAIINGGETQIHAIATADGTPLPGDVVDLAIAVSTQGQVCLAWAQDETRDVEGAAQFRSNVYMASFANAENLPSAPVSVTGKTDYDDLNAPFLFWDLTKFQGVQIEAPAADRCFIAWNKEWLVNHYVRLQDQYSVRDYQGAEVKAVTDVPPPSGFFNGLVYDGPIRLVTLEDGNVLMLRDHEEEVAVTMYDPAGNAMPTNAPPSSPFEDPRLRTFTTADLERLSNGDALMPFVDSYRSHTTGFALTFINASTHTADKSSYVMSPDQIEGVGAISLLPEADGRAVLIWGDWNPAAQKQFYYSYIDSAGSPVTPATVFLDDAAAGGSAHRIYGSTNGYGIAANILDAPTSTSQPDVFVSAPLLVSGAPRGTARIVMQLGNRGLQAATGVAVSAVIDPPLTFAGASPTPDDVAADASGTTLTWYAPALDYLTSGRIVLSTGIPSTTIGATFQVTVSITAAQADAIMTNNVVTSTVMAAQQYYAPYVGRDAD